MRDLPAVYFEHTLDLTRTTPFIERYNARGEGKIGLFHVYTYAAARALGARPRLNRFTMGGRVYQRDGVWIAFSAKRAMDIDAPVLKSVVEAADFDSPST